MVLFKYILNGNRLRTAAIIAAAVVFPSIAFAAPATVSSAVNLRAGPGANYARIATLPAGSRVDAGACRAGWCRVGDGGWISLRYISFNTYRPAYMPRPSTTVIIDSSRYDDRFPPFGWGPRWRPGWDGPDWGPGPRRPHGWRPDRPHGWGPDRPPRWPHRGPGRPPYWGPGPVIGPQWGGNGRNPGGSGGGLGNHGGNRHGGSRASHAGR